MTAQTCARYDAARLQAMGLQAERLPRHLAVIMDGNGRWARQQGWQRIRGHERGARVVRDITTEAARLGVEWLTLYAFSAENWSRPQREIDYLMKLLANFLDDELPTLLDNDIRFRVIGRLERLPESVRSRAERNCAQTAQCRSMTMTLALSYGGRDELVDACKRVAALVAAGRISVADIDEAAIGAQLYDPQAPDVDLLIRTAGEQRVSNFLVWQSVYAEYISVSPCWPDFDSQALIAALRDYQSRERRFGCVDEVG